MKYEGFINIAISVSVDMSLDIGTTRLPFAQVKIIDGENQ